MSYLITFGIAMAFRENLVDSVRQQDVYGISFDEAFNKILQLDQMDIMVRFWQADRVVIRYLGSEYLDHTRAEDLLQAIKQGLSMLDQGKLVHAGMDGLNINLKLLEQLQADRRKQDLNMPELLDIGTCNLHVVHGAFQTGVAVSLMWVSRYPNLPNYQCNQILHVYIVTVL